MRLGPKFTGSYKKKTCSGSDIVLNEIDDATDGADFILTHARFEQQKYRQWLVCSTNKVPKSSNILTFKYTLENTQDI